MKAANRADYLASAPTSARGIVARAFARTASPRMAIKAKCLDCCHFDRAEVAGCTVLLCPLHPYRPFQDDRKSSKSASHGEISATTHALGGTTS
jgi:hypothetical protein